MKEYACTVKLEIYGFNQEADNESEYREKVKEQFFEDYGIFLTDNEITDIEVMEEFTE